MNSDDQMASQPQDYKQLCQQIIRQWQREKVPLNPGATNDELSAFENCYSVKLPNDFRYLYSLVNGMQNFESDKHLFSLWSLTRITTESDDVIVGRDVASLHIEIPFGDFLIDSHRYYLVQQREKFIVKTNIDEKIMATSFAHFVEIYLFDPDKLYLM